MSESILRKESIQETQTVTFVLDGSADFKELGRLDFSKYQKAIVFCDKALESSWWPLLKNILKDRIPMASVEFLEASEETKNLESYVRLANLLGQLRCSRDDLLIAVGGGTILDAISYLASTYMRVVPLMMIPTTLIGQADASTAGKTCINTEYAKNVLGTLYLPVYVYNNVSLLHTNSPYHQRQGFSEIFKYALLGSRRLLGLLQDYKKSPTDPLMMEILGETIDVRLSLRRRDPLASNFGHTFGHALEKISNFGVNHGDAISVGMVMAMELSVQNKIISPALRDEIVSLMEHLGLNTKVDASVDPDKLTQLMLTDKKSSNTSVRFVLIQDIAKPLETDGKPFYPVEPPVVAAFLKTFMKNSKYVQAQHWAALKG